MEEWEPARSVPEGQDSNPDYHFLRANTTGAQVTEPSLAHTSSAEPGRRLQAAPCLTSLVWYIKFNYRQFCGLSPHPNTPLLKAFLSPSLLLPPHPSLSPPPPLCPLLQTDVITSPPPLNGTPSLFLYIYSEVSGGPHRRQEGTTSTLLDSLAWGSSDVKNKPLVFRHPPFLDIVRLQQGNGPPSV